MAAAHESTPMLKSEEPSFLWRYGSVTWTALTTKAFAVLLGWTFKYSIAYTCLGIALGVRPRLHHESLHAEGKVISYPGPEAILFVLYVFFAAGASMLTNQSSLPPSVKTAFAAGWAYIPAWSLKCLASTYISHVVDWNGSAVVHLMVSMSILSTTSATNLFAATESEGMDKQSFSFSVFATLGACLALTNGFAVDDCVHSVLFPSFSGTAPFESVYATACTACIPSIQKKVKELIQARQDAADHPVLQKLVPFLLVSLNFVCAWSWQDVIDALLKPMVDGTGFAAYLLLAVTITLMMLGMIAIGLLPFLQGGEHDIFMVAAGLNIAWAWMDFAVDAVGEGVTSLETLWGITAVVLLVVFLVAAGGDLIYAYFFSHGEATSEV